MKTIVIYQSKSGFTEKYGNMIAEELGCEAIALKKVTSIDLEEYDTIIYGGGLRAGIISGLKKMNEICIEKGKKDIILFATGASPKEMEKDIQAMWERNITKELLETVPHFYMQGGLCYEKMSLPDKIIMKLAAPMLEKQMGIEGSVSLRKSYDESSKEYIIPLVEYVKNRTL